jgi:XTP/dITP diphosphohydrolase
LSAAQTPLRLFCATSNPGKAREFALAAGEGIVIQPLPDFRAIPPCVEDGATFGENAVIKARHYGAHAPGLLFADDSGLEVDALGGAPGVISARFSSPGATDQSNNRLLLEKLRGVEDRRARFVCAIALVDGGRLAGVYTGSVEGIILDSPRGSGGFGYDPLFYYPPFACTFGEVEGERKFAVSHRGQALRSMLRALVRQVSDLPIPGGEPGANR